MSCQRPFSVPPLSRTFIHGLAHQGVFHSVALSLKDNQVTMMDESVNHCRSHLLVGEGPAPLGELKIRTKDEVFALITVTDDPE